MTAESDATNHTTTTSGNEFIGTVCLRKDKNGVYTPESLAYTTLLLEKAGGGHYTPETIAKTLRKYKYSDEQKEIFYHIYNHQNNNNSGEQH